MIYKNSKKGGLAVGTNQPSRETLTGLGASLLALLAVGFFSLIGKKKSHARKQDKNGKKVHKLLNLAVILPTAFRLGKGIAAKLAVDNFKKQFEEGVNQAADQLGIDRDDGTNPIEVEYAIPIGSEAEVYEYVKENEV